MTKCDYTKILEKREKRQRENMEEDYNNPQVIELRNHVREVVTRKVAEQRISFIQNITLFSENPNKIQTKFYAKYHRNLRLILHSEEKSNLDDFEKCKTIKISEIDEILTGKDCPHVKVKTRKQNFVNQAFSIRTKANQSGVNFVAESQAEQLMWTDGIKSLIKEFQYKNHRMSNQFDEDVDSLMKMKMRINLVQFKSDQNIEIPESFPDISTLEAPPPEWVC